MIKQLIKLANHLDAKGLRKEADRLDKVLRSVLEMVEDESVDISKTEAGDELEFDLFIDNKGRVVGAEPASGDLGSTCIINEEGSDDVTDVDEEDKRSGKKEICVVDVEDSCAMQMTDALLEELKDTLEEWEEKDYKSDEARYKAYYKDIEDTVKEFEDIVKEFDVGQGKRAFGNTSKMVKKAVDNPYDPVAREALQQALSDVGGRRRWSKMVDAIIEGLDRRGFIIVLSELPKPPTERPPTPKG